MTIKTTYVWHVTIHPRKSSRVGWRDGERTRNIVLLLLFLLLLLFCVSVPNNNELCCTGHLIDSVKSFNGILRSLSCAHFYKSTATTRSIGLTKNLHCFHWTKSRKKVPNFFFSSRSCKHPDKKSIFLGVRDLG